MAFGMARVDVACITRPPQDGCDAMPELGLLRQAMYLKGAHSGVSQQDRFALLATLEAYSSCTFTDALPETSDHAGGSWDRVSSMYSIALFLQRSAAGCFFGTGMRTAMAAGPFQSLSILRIAGSLHGDVSSGHGRGITRCSALHLSPPRACIGLQTSSQGGKTLCRTNVVPIRNAWCTGHVDDMFMWTYNFHGV